MCRKEVSKNIQAIFYLGGWTAFFKSLSFYPDWDESKAISIGILIWPCF